MANEERGWRDGWWRSGDGLRLHYRDYPGDATKAPVLCLPGLTRTARDFEAVAARLAGTRRVIVAELRGRGLSAPSPDPEDYNPKVYLEDVGRLLVALGLGPVVVFGTSLGGIVAMLMGATGLPLAGVLLNDIAPIVEEEGLERIRGYIGGDKRWGSWEEAARATAATHRSAYPDYAAADWEAMARRLCREEGDAIVPDHDPAIAVLARRPTQRAAEPWRLVEGFRSIPGLIVRGELSDILSAEVAEETVARLPEMKLATVPRVGHPPVLDEPEAAVAIDRLLARIDARAGATSGV